MLLIWDIHISARYKDKILTELKKFVEQNPQEQNIIFLWDYVYHFSYDRESLLELYNFFVSLFHQWKNVYILAGNHDWLWSSFVFQEAQKAFDIITNINTKNWESEKWKLKFITESYVDKIEGENILFLPYNLGSERVKFEEKSDLKFWDKLDKLKTTIKMLSESNNKNEKKSAEINQIILNNISNYDQLTIIHHYYINNISFPWQKSKFSYKDVALSESFLNLENIKLISWHMHQAFIFKNYFCAGSIWSTSSLEVNQLKWLFSYANKELNFTSTNINPYIFIAENNLNQENLQNFIQELYQNYKSNFSSESVWKINFPEKINLNLNDISLSIKVDDLDYEKMDEYIPSDLRVQLKDVKLKKDYPVMKDLVRDFEVSAKNLSIWFTDRKNILKSYILQKYWSDAPKYEIFLKEAKII